MKAPPFVEDIRNFSQDIVPREMVEKVIEFFIGLEPTDPSIRLLKVNIKSI